MARRVVLMKLNCSLGHCECDGHTVHKLSQQRLTADRLAPRQSDCSRMHSKVSSDWLPSYTKATPPVLEIFKMAGYFPETPRILYMYNTYILYIYISYILYIYVVYIITNIIIRETSRNATWRRIWTHLR